MSADEGFPRLKPAFTAVLDIEPGLPIGALSSGPTLVWVKIKSGTLKSHPDFPTPVNATLISGADWIHGDPSGSVQRLDVRSVFKTEDGSLLNFSYLGLIQMDPAIASIFTGEAKPGLVTNWSAITHKFIQTGAEQYKSLADGVFVAVGRFHVSEGGVAVEYKISQVVST
ncbi:hypothetical protein DRE_00097 [Drechslerella stenobrocha 248]|uniref:Uncharacterized protein n=1 Tax=Drechslerella stenobrocha 248 TaxID=1043628 RepID=W7I9M3_9PEZI|nr:hypothetical protein DRE_00097 [Drechslerella stenobrocha 248]